VEEKSMNLVNIPEKAPQGVAHSTFRSTLMNGVIGYNIYLPPNYHENERRYPVMYFLHGRGGNESSDIWISQHLHKLLADADEEISPMIIVFPNGMETSGYRNSQDNSMPMESIIIDELLTHIDGTDRTLANREHRVIEGFSMGGQGALFLASKHPDLFCSAVSYAGAFFDWDDLVQRGNEEQMKVYNNDPALFAPYTAYYWCTENAAEIRSGVKIRIIVGKKDFLYENNIKMHKHLESLEIAHEYDELDDVDHNIGMMYDMKGREGLRFHSSNIQK
jgi:enterochelin esterase-like enzyme